MRSIKTQNNKTRITSYYLTYNYYKMNKVIRLLVAVPVLFLASCGGSDGDLSSYGLKAKIGAEGVSVSDVNLHTNVKQTVLVGKSIKIKKGDVKVSMSETDKPIDIAKEKKSAEMWSDRKAIVLDEADALIIENKEGAFKGFEVFYSKEGQGTNFKFDVESGDGFRIAETLEDAKEGLAIARSIKFEE